MNEQVRQMEREVEEDRGRDIREREQKTGADREGDVGEEQEVEVDKGRSTKNITVKITVNLTDLL